MNKMRRNRLIKLNDKVQEIIVELEDILSEEQEYLNNMPENLYGSERYEKADCACSELQGGY